MFASAASNLSRSAAGFLTRPVATSVNSQRQYSSWSEQFFQATSKLTSDVSFQESAEQLREICKSDLLKVTDLRDDPQRFFEAHRILARHSVEHGPGFWIRFTVHYNLFGGTILAAGNKQQVDELAEYQRKGELGCFGLTEKLAGVQSGLVVQTTADFDADTQEFILNTPTYGARKNWISQGFVADKAVVMAELKINGDSKGPQAFVMDFRKDGELVKGIEVDDMGKKTTGNDLDNAWVAFDNVRIPKSAILSKYADVEDNEYVFKTQGVRPFDMIGQRLYTGRIAVAQAALTYRKELFKRTKDYSDSKKTFAFKGEPVLSNIPQLKALYEVNDRKLAELEDFVGKCELALSECLKQDKLPSSKLVDAIATCKVQAVENSIDACFKLKQEVGSFALMDSAGFKHMDFLQCCKFAEGDSRILMQKMARDRMKLFSKDGESGDADEVAICKDLVSGISKQVANGATQGQAWDLEWENVYKLADAVMARVQRDGL